MTDATELATLFASVSESLASSADEPMTFERVVTQAVDLVPGCDECGLTLRTQRSTLSSAASSGPRAERADNLQYELSEGPCLEAAFEHEIFTITDLRDEPRWPRWSRAAADIGIRSCLAVSLRSEDGLMGALNFYGERPGAFSDEADGAMAAIFAVHAGAALRRARLVTGLTSALESRHDIGMAQGVLAAVYDISYEAAFEVLRRYSSHTNTKLRLVAEQVLELRSLPGLDDVPPPPGDA